jgi:DNA polymerase-3 subunit delta'
LELADEQLGEMREVLLGELCQASWDAVAFSKRVSQFVDEAGKDAPPRRRRMNQLIEFAAEFYRQLMRTMSGLPIEGDTPLERAVNTAIANWSGDAEAAAACLQRCLDAQSHIRANVNQANLLDWWLDELATITRTGKDDRLSASTSLG